MPSTPYRKTASVRPTAKALSGVTTAQSRSAPSGSSKSLIGWKVAPRPPRLYPWLLTLVTTKRMSEDPSVW